MGSGEGALPLPQRAKIFESGMSTQYTDLYPPVCSLLNLWQGFVKASKGRRSHPSVAAFEYELEKELIALRDELECVTYRALDRCTYFMRRYACVLPCDVTQFFPSIDEFTAKRSSNTKDTT